MSSKATKTVDNRKAKCKLKPELRFVEFQDKTDWETCSLGEKTKKVGSGITPRGGSSNYRSEGRPFIRSQNIGWGELLLDDIVFIDEDTHSTFASTEIEEDDVFLNITGASIGRSAVADHRVHEGNVNQHVCIIRLRNKELLAKFLNQYLLSEYGQMQIDSFQAGGNRQGLNFSQVRSFTIPLPLEIEEQQKIADCFSSLDDRITAETQKLDTLKAHKKGLMQKLFPAEGETLPKLRFPEFADDWFRDVLSHHMKLISGMHLAPDAYDNSRDKAKVPYFTGPSDFTNDIGEVSKWTSENKKFASRGDTLLTVKGSGVGQLMFLELAEVAMGRQLMAISAAPDTKKFIFYCLAMKRPHFEALASGNMIPGIARGDILNTKMPFPKDSKEQRKIANCLSSLDELITAQTQKIATLKTHKKGLMQQLFPSFDEVKR